MQQPTYITLEQARQVLADLGIELNARQMKRAAEPDAHGRRKLPFFKDPIDGRLKINQSRLIAVYQRCEVDAENSLRKPEP